MSQEANLARLLLNRFRWFDNALRSTLAREMGASVTSAQSLLFAELPLEGARQTELARSLGVSRQAVNDLVQGSQRQGLVELVTDPTSARSKLVQPTAKGRRSVAIALSSFAASESALRAQVGDRHVDALRAALAAEWGPSPQ